MGSFNTTCFATNQTIAPGDECYVIPILQESGYNEVQLTRGEKSLGVYAVANSTCYAHCFWNPCGQFIEAVYDDYGDVKVVDNVNNAQRVWNLLHMVQDKAYTTGKGENQYHENEFTPVVMSDIKERADIYRRFDALWHSVSQYRVFVQNYHGIPRQMLFAIISKVAYDKLVAMYEKFKTWDDKPLHRDTLIKNVVAAALAARNEKHDSDKNDSYFAVRSEFETLSRIGRSEGARDYSHVSVNALMSEVLKEGTASPEKIASVKMDITDGYVMGSMNCLNIKISPLVYASQDYDNSIGRDYANFVRSVSAKISKNRNNND